MTNLRRRIGGGMMRVGDFYTTLVLLVAKAANLSGDAEDLRADIEDRKHRLFEHRKQALELEREVDDLVSVLIAHLPEEAVRRLKQFERDQDDKAAARKRYRTRRIQKARASVGAFTDEEFAALVEEFNGRCVACLTPAFAGDPLVPDHVRPIAIGGRDSIDNIQPMHRWCNQEKAKKWIDYRDSAKARLEASHAG